MSTPHKEVPPLWEVLPGPRPELPDYCLTLDLQPGPDPVRYAVQSGWAETGPGPALRNRLERTVDLCLVRL